MDTGNYERRGALIAARIRTAADNEDRPARMVVNAAHEVAQRWLLGDISDEKRSGMEYALRAVVATSGYADQAVADRDTPTIAATVASLVKTAAGV